MMAIILVFLEVFKHFRRDLTLAKEAFETAKGTSVMLFSISFFTQLFYIFSKKQPFMICSNSQLNYYHPLRSCDYTLGINL